MLFLILKYDLIWKCHEIDAEIREISVNSNTPSVNRNWKSGLGNPVPWLHWSNKPHRILYLQYRYTHDTRLAENYFNNSR